MSENEAFWQRYGEQYTQNPFNHPITGERINADYFCAALEDGATPLLCAMFRVWKDATHKRPTPRQWG
jgi:hypothetical protein